MKRLNEMKDTDRLIKIVEDLYGLLAAVNEVVHSAENDLAIRCDGDTLYVQYEEDGRYRYTWGTRFGVHTVYYGVKDGVVLENIASVRNSLKPYEGKQFSKFCKHRESEDWNIPDKLEKI